MTILELAFLAQSERQRHSQRCTMSKRNHDEAIMSDQPLAEAHDATAPNKGGQPEVLLRVPQVGVTALSGSVMQLMTDARSPTETVLPPKSAR